MRARLAVHVARQTVELREVVLRDKPAAFLAASPSATVPCLVVSGGAIDESLDIMRWALAMRDPGGWLEMPEDGFALIETNDGAFKEALDRYKYATRHPGIDPLVERARASDFLRELEHKLKGGAFLFGARPTLADMAILPFVRQFAHVDLEWFSDQPWPHLLAWLSRFKTSQSFAAIMHKYPQWTPQSEACCFPE